MTGARWGFRARSQLFHYCRVRSASAGLDVALPRNSGSPPNGIARQTFNVAAIEDKFIIIDRGHHYRSWVLYPSCSSEDTPIGVPAKISKGVSERAYQSSITVETI